MANKITYTADLIPLKEASKLFPTEDDFIHALKFGRITAYGRSYADIEMDKPSGNFLPIAPQAWSSLVLNDEDELFGQVEYAVGQYEYERIGEIYIDKTTIESLGRKPKGRGRPAEYDWDSFWRAVAYHLYTGEDVHGDEVPTSLRDWARNAHYAYPFLWEAGKGPKETTIEDKLRPLFDALNQDSYDPIQKQSAKNGGN